MNETRTGDAARRRLEQAIAESHPQDFNVEACGPYPYQHDPLRWREAMLRGLVNRRLAIVSLVKQAEEKRAEARVAVKECNPLDRLLGKAPSRAALDAVCCPRRSKFDPPCRFKSDPGMEAGREPAGCGQV